MFKRALSLILCFTLLLQPALVQANSVADAFSSLLAGASSNVSGPGHLQSQTRHVFTGGGAEIRFGQKKMTFISIQPPSLNIGCNGISMHFGGFSFINGTQIAQLLQNIAQAAVAFAIKLAIKTLCPQCEAVLSELTALAQKAAQMGKDSCQIGQQLADAAFNALFPKTTGDKGANTSCATLKNVDGSADDFVYALTSNICRGISAIGSWFDTTFGESSSNKQDKTKGAAFQGNLVWLALKSMGFDKESSRIIMSVTGTSINYIRRPGLTVGCHTGPVGSLDESKEKEVDTCTMPSIILGTDVMSDLLMCGTTGATSIHPPVFNYCSKRNSAGNLNWSINTEIYDCEPDGVNADPYDQCLNPVPKSVTTLDTVNGGGFLEQVYLALHAGVEAVKDGTPLPANTISLINAVPFPLYRLINIAAVYPQAARDLIDANAEIIAYLMANALLQRMLTMQEKPKGSALPPAAAKELRDLLYSMQDSLRQEYVKVNNYMALQEGMMKKINDVNKAVQTQVMSQGLLSNHSFAVGVMKGAK